VSAIRRILFYTHDSVGVGHVFRARALITGMRRWRPDIDFLVLSGTSVPHILMREGIEVIKLPGVEKVMTGAQAPAGASAPRQSAIGGEDQQYRPRHLRSLPLASVMRLRRRIIAESYRWFRPDVLMVEHYLGGLLDEMAPVLQSDARGDGGGVCVKVALSRGITGAHREVFTVAGSWPAETLLKYYDRLYCLDDETTVNRDGRYGGLSDETAAKVACLGRIADMCPDELPERGAVCERFSLTSKPIILFALSRHGDVAGLCTRFLEAFSRLGLDRGHQVVFVIDPYLDREVVETIRRHPLAAGVRFLPFFYPLADIVHASDLVVCRAGYNTVNELLLTGVKAVVIPERHPSGEQESRAAGIPRDNITVMAEEAVLRAPTDAALKDLLARAPVPLCFAFDKYAIGERIIADLEADVSLRRRSSRPPSPRSPAKAPGTARGAGSC